MKAYIWIVSRGEDGQTMAEYAVVLGRDHAPNPASDGGFGFLACMLGVKLCCGLQVAFE